jgi:hypothetical protein
VAIWPGGIGMGSKKNLNLKRISFGVLIVVCILSAELIVAAQGWRTGGAKAGTSSNSETSTAKKSVPTRASNAKTPKSAKAARTNGNAAKSNEPKANPSKANPNTDSMTNLKSRERLVNHNKNAAPNETSAGGAVKKSATKSAGSTRVAAATARSGRCDPDQDERTDLSGTYTGNINYPADGLTGEATLTISGNRFTLSAGPKTETGNITAVTTCTYTAVAMMFGQWRTPKPGERAEPPLPMLSLRAIRKGEQLMLKASPSERREFSFEPAAKK